MEGRGELSWKGAGVSRCEQVWAVEKRQVGDMGRCSG